MDVSWETVWFITSPMQQTRRLSSACSPDAVQRVALAERCAAEPGPYKARCSLRSRFSEAALRAASRPGNGSAVSRSPDAAQRVALAERCAAEPGPYKARCSL